MQTTATAPRASNPEAPAIPALMPNPDYTEISAGICWAIHALNDDACVQALEVVAKPIYRQAARSGDVQTEQIAITRALELCKDVRNSSFNWCADSGGLLYAWRGSRALLQTLPSSLRGAQ